MRIGPRPPSSGLVEFDLERGKASRVNPPRAVRRCSGSSLTQSGEVFHHRFPFLKAEEAARLKKTQEDVDAGRIDLLEMYREAAPIFRAEQEAADGQMLARRDVGL